MTGGEAPAAPPAGPYALFHAPLKAPDHPTPSGDRAVARLMMAALARAGLPPVLASRRRAFDRDGDAALIARLDAEAAREAGALVAAHRARPPALWFTYHCHHKAPDLLGPRVARGLGVPLVIAEASRAAKRARGAFAAGHRASEAAIDAAALVLALTARDAAELRRLAPPGQRVVDLAPFLDPDAWPLALPRGPRPPGPPRLLAAAMMRAGDKLASYRLLAEALARLAGRPWTLDVAGDGPAREAVAAALAPLGDRVRHHGALAPPALGALYRAADLLVWPAVNEAYGVAPLEAALHGLPALLGDEGGVRAVVEDGATGALAPPRDAAAFAAALAALLDEPARLAALGARAAARARDHHGLDAAAATLRAALAPLLAGRAA